MYTLRGRQGWQGGGVTVGVQGHVRFDLRSQIGGHIDAGGVGDRGGCLLQIGGHIPSRGASRAHRSMPPRIGSSIASGGDHVGDVGARAMSASACRFTKDGSRMCTLAGFDEPSERTKQPSSPRGDSIGL